MKIARLIEMITILLNKGTVTASDLAQRFEVSVRTIYRDIDTLCAAGIPIYTSPGAGGGITILEQYSLNRSFLSAAEKKNILFALETLSVTGHPETASVLEKLQTLFQDTAEDWIEVDMTRWGAPSSANQYFSALKLAILNNRVVSMTYINARQECVSREFEPHKLIFKSSAWYVSGYCLKRNSFRLFRLSRIIELCVTDKCFTRRRANEQCNPPGGQYPPPVHLVLQFQRAALSRLYDDYDHKMIHDNHDGTYRLELDFPEDEWVYGYLLSFGPLVKVLDPPHIREILSARCQEILQFYQST